MQVDERDEEANLNNDTVVREPSVSIVDCSNVADWDHSLESKYKVFLSHDGAQKDFVEQLCVDLERWDRYPFFDKRQSSLLIGEKFPRLILMLFSNVVLEWLFYVRTFLRGASGSC